MFDIHRVFLRRQSGIGWTLNWANPISWIMLAAIAALAFLF